MAGRSSPTRTDALQRGGRTYLDVHTGADLAPLRDDPAFQELIRPKG